MSDPDKNLGKSFDATNSANSSTNAGAAGSKGAAKNSSANGEQIGMATGDLGMLPEGEQRDIEELTAPDPTQHETKWATYRKLPKNYRWPYFYRHFFWPIIAAILITAAIVAFVVHIFITPHGQGLSVAYINMEESSSQMAELKDGYVKAEDVNAKLVSMDNGFFLDSTNRVSAEGSDNDLETMISANSLNTLVGPKATIEAQAKRGFVEPLESALTASQLKKLQDEGAVVKVANGSGKEINGALDLSKSAKWKATGGLDGAVVGFVNVNESEYVKKFVDYLFDL